MNNPRLLPVILAGGSGERLWPLSRTAYPKQFLALLGAKHSLFQATIQRLSSNPNYLPPIIVCHVDYRFIIAEQLRAIDAEYSAIILEPSANNTAPAIALAAHWAINNTLTNSDEEQILLVLPADHHIVDHAALHAAIDAATPAAQSGALVTFGVSVTAPETGYGYIQAGAAWRNTTGNHVAKFIEKPDLDTAHILMQDPKYSWNSGMFLFRAQTYLDELNLVQPKIVAATHIALNSAQMDLDFIRPAASCYQNCPAISIDYAVMEHTKQAVVFKLNTTWSDIGSWQSVWEQSAKDQAGNSVTGDVIAHESSNCLIDARHRLVTTLDVHDLAIIETADAILIAKRDRSQGIKQLVANLKQISHTAATEHRQVHRPWGWYDQIGVGANFQVKHIFVAPGKSLSLQMHQHRSEHWIIVKGSAQVIKGEQTFVLHENESTFIPSGTKHQLTNLSTIALELIEVQSGSYLGEDDIVRFADEHGRATVNA